MDGLEWVASCLRRTRTISLAIILAIFLALSACSNERARPAEDAAGKCATLPLFTRAIVEVMQRQPEWSPLTPAGRQYETRWKVEDAVGSHELSIRLEPDGCICAATATSRFRGSRSQGELAGLMQGAAVAAVSDLSYTDSWLQPKLLLRCPIAFLLRDPYEAEKSMPDGTLWRLACTGDPAGVGGMSTSLSISRSGCGN